MPTIALVSGVRIIIYPKDHLPPHLHAKLAEHEAMISIVTGDVLEGSLPSAKLKVVQSWLAAHREEVAYVWQEIRARRYQGGMIEE
ncbi:MAG TPA: DUF4160 domain-containing protein [Hyphomicrobiaceae bacterium]|jgi:hypothetical protein